MEAVTGEDRGGNIPDWLQDRTQEELKELLEFANNMKGSEKDEALRIVLGEITDTIKIVQGISRQREIL